MGLLKSLIMNEISRSNRKADLEERRRYAEKLRDEEIGRQRRKEFDRFARRTVAEKQLKDYRQKMLNQQRAFEERMQDKRTADKREFELEKMKKRHGYQKDLLLTRRKSLMDYTKQMKSMKNQTKQKIKTMEKVQKSRIEGFEKKENELKSKVNLLKKELPGLAARIAIGGGNVEDYINSKAPDDYLNAIDPTMTTEGWKALKRGEPVENVQPAASPEDKVQHKLDTMKQGMQNKVVSPDIPSALSKFQDPEGGMLGREEGSTQPPQQNEPPVQQAGPQLPPQLAKFQDPSSGPSDVPSQPVSPPSPPQATAAQPAPPSQGAPLPQQRPPSTPEQSLAKPAPVPGQPGFLQGVGQALRRAGQQAAMGPAGPLMGRMPGPIGRGMGGFGQGFNAGTGRALSGLAQLGAQGLQKAGALSKGQYDKFTKDLDKGQKKMFKDAVKKFPDVNPKVIKAGVISGEIAPYLVGGAGIGAGRSVLGSAAKLGALGAGTGAAQFVPPGARGGRGVNTLIGSLAGAAGGAGAGALGKIFQNVSQKGAKLGLAKALQQARADKMGGDRAMAAARRMGTNLPMPEATGHPGVMGMANRIRSLSPDVKRGLISQVIKRERDLKLKANKILKGVVNKDFDQQLTLKEINKKFFQNEKRYTKLLENLREQGMRTQPAKDMRTILDRLSKSPMGKLMARDTDLVTGMAIDQGPTGVMTRTAQALFKRRYNNEIVRLMMGSKWDKELNNIAKIKSDPQMLDRLAKLLTIMAPVGSSRVGGKK